LESIFLESNGTSDQEVRENGRKSIERCTSAWHKEYSEFRDELVPALEKTCGFLSSLYQAIERPRNGLLDLLKKKQGTPVDESKDKDDEELKVLIVGGGPVGLMSAIESYKQGNQYI
jgi:hypothetical protein